MTTPPGGQYPPQYPQQYPQQYPPQQQYYQGQPPGGGGRKALPWIVGAVVVVAALVVTLVLTLGGDDNGDDDNGGGNTAGGNSDGGSESGGVDLSTPEKAAEAFAAAARTRDADEVIKLTCLGVDGCLEQLGEGSASEADIEEAKQEIRDNIDRFAEEMAEVEFGEATEASIPEAMEVPYTTPEDSEGDYSAFMFVEFEGDWLYAGSAGGSSSGGGGGASPPTT